MRGIVTAVIARGVKESDLDPHSRNKLRWYSEASGQLHRDEISRRKIVTENGKKKVVLTDDKGRIIDEYATPSLPKKEIKFISNNVEVISPSL